MLKKEDLKIGMQVTLGELAGIYNTYFLVKGLTSAASSACGELVYFGDTPLDESRKELADNATFIYFDKDEMTGEVIYDE